MLTHRQIGAAARIGMAVAERDVASAYAQVMVELRHLFPLDACALIGIDSIGGFAQLDGITYTPQETRAMAADFVGTPWYRKLVNGPPTGSICLDTDVTRSPFYEKHVRPAGYRDGMIGMLRRDGLLVGMIQFSTEQAGVFDREANELLRALLPSLAMLADPVRQLAWLGDAPPAACVALAAADGSFAALPGRPLPLLLGDDAFHALLGSFVAAQDDRWSFLWPSGRIWHRVDLVGGRSAGAVGRGGFVIVTEVTELPYRLNPREVEVLTRLSLGWSNQGIAREMSLSHRTVEVHVRNVLRKLGVDSRSGAAALAVRESILCPAVCAARSPSAPPGPPNSPAGCRVPWAAARRWT